MNSYERKQLKRAQGSWQNWKKKAKERHQQLHKFKQKVQDLTTSRDMWRQKYALLEKEQKESALVTQERVVSNEMHAQQLYFIMVSICLNLSIHCAVSFRAVPKILAIFSNTLELFGVPIKLMIPHFTSVIHWTLRLGKSLLNRHLQPIITQWICIMDHTMHVGTKKAFVILKVPVDAMQSDRALTLSDVEVLYLKVQDTWNGHAVEACLKDVFALTGSPVQIVIDGGPDLHKGVRQVSQNMDSPCKVTYDITHLIAKLLKKKYKNHPTFRQIMSQLAKMKNKIQQTVYSYLIPLKERAKSRFLNLPSLAKWTTQVIDYVQVALSNAAMPKKQQEELKEHFSWLFQYQSFLEDLGSEIQILSQLQALLKNVSLTEFTYKKACSLINQLDDATLKEPLIAYLDTEWQFSRHQPYRTLLTSDIIESLFGKYKYLVKPNSFSEMNRMVLMLPTICQEITPRLIQEAFENTKQRDLQQWIKEEIDQTLLAKRKKALAKKITQPKNTDNVIPFPDKKERAINAHSFGQKTARTKQALG